MGRRGRKQRGRNQSKAEAHRRELPPDIIFSQILRRLPVKILLRFKCVSKEWHSSLTTPTFAKLQLQHHVDLDLLTPKLVALSTTQPYKFFTIDCERPRDGFTAGPLFPFKFALGHKHEGPFTPLFLTCAQGLLCVGINKSWVEYSDLVLWNPATNDHKILSKPPTSFNDCYLINSARFVLYYSSCDDEYKLVCVTSHPNVYIYSLKSDSWRKVESDFKCVIRPCNYWSSEKQQSKVSLNGTVYFLEVCIIHQSAFSIVMFNTKNETLKVIETPHFGYQEARVTCLKFKVERDECIHMWVNINSFSSTTRNELWMMDKEGYWTMLVKSLTSYGYYPSQPMHLMMNEHLLVYDSALGRVYEVDMKTDTQDLHPYTTESMCIWHVGLEYIETMVSPNQYIN